MLVLCKEAARAGVSGWIGQRKDFLKVWSTLEAPDSEIFTLVWESKALLALNSAIGSFMAQQAYQEIAKWTITHVTAWLDPPLQQPTWLHPACLLDTWLSVCCMPCLVGEMARMTSFQEAYRTALLLVL